MVGQACSCPPCVGVGRWIKQETALKRINGVDLTPHEGKGHLIHDTTCSCNGGVVHCRCTV